MEEGNGNAELAPTAEDDKKLVDVQVNIEPGDAARLIEGLKVNLEPIEVAQNVEVGVTLGTHWPPPSTSRRSARIRVKYSGTRNADVKFLKEKVKEWERKDDVASMFENGESSNAPTQVSILGETVERTLVTLVTRCAQYENQITTLKTKVGVLDEVDEATDEGLKSYDEERVMQEHILFQLNDRIRKLEEEMMEH
ncbi:hypothetical protein QVD17_30659 [Tagetes erecta]|uniref:Uncharacterized protein n=1 Tax=Tagetes erecta TaxID=13708 RepID=A0AAD8K614_TARER|nr:hypothetical protein QVD17_30659 [Tagetes erecta]